MKNTMMVLVVALVSLTFAGCKPEVDKDGGYIVGRLVTDDGFSMTKQTTTIGIEGLHENLANVVVDGKNYTFIRPQEGLWKGDVFIYQTKKLLPSLFKVIGGTVYAVERDKDGRETLKQQ